MANPPSSLLLGPPEIHNPIPSPSADPHPDAASDDPAVHLNLLVAKFNDMETDWYSELQRGFTENMSGTFLSTGNPCLDFFFHVVPDTSPESIAERLRLAWDRNPLTTLKLICNLRAVRGTGKSDKEGYYAAVFWLHQNHPKTLACNIPSLAGFGYFKDLPEILYRLLEGLDVRRNLAKQRPIGVRRRMPMMGRRRFGPPRTKHMKKPGVPNRSPSTRESRITEEKARVEKEIETARESRNQKRISQAKKAIERFNRDPDYRFLYERISDFFSNCLKSDVELLGSGKPNKISLAAKWCPSLDSSFDRSTLLCESIARKLFPRESYPEYEGIEEAKYAYRVRDRLRKEVLVPLRKTLELPEVYMGANDWSSLPYNRVASVAMKTYKKLFLKHDEERFSEYLENVRAGKAKIAAGALLPHEIIAALDDEDGGVVAELQWKRMVEDVTKNGKLNNCLAVCDVSGSMEGIPMEVSVALGVLVSEISEEPWKGKLISFSECPELHLVEGNDLKSKTEFVRNMAWGMNTDFQKVFDLILQVAVEGNLKEEQMVKRVFVFSDMEFDMASRTPWETDYEVITRKYKENGYGSAVPEIVFWNLRDSRATPVPGTQKGVALVSGFSKNLLKIFLEEGGIVSPEAVMEAAISGEEYQKLVVLD